MLRLSREQWWGNVYVLFSTTQSPGTQYGSVLQRSGLMKVAAQDYSALLYSYIVVFKQCIVLPCINCINLCCIQSFICYITLFQVSNLQISIYSNYPLLISNLQVGNFYNNYLQVVKNLTTIATVYESLSLLVFAADCCFLSLLFSGNLFFTLSFGFFGYGYRTRLRIYENEKVAAGSQKNGMDLQPYTCYVQQQQQY